MSSSGNKRDGIVVTGSSAKNGPQKRAKCVKQQHLKQHPQDPFDLLTDDATLFPIFEFIGPYHFRFIAAVNRRWRSLYTLFQRQEYRKRVKNEEDFGNLISTLITSTASIAESLSRAKVFLSDTRKLTGPFKPIEIEENGSQKCKAYDATLPFVSFLRDHVAVQHGHVEILQLAIVNGCTCDKETSWRAAREGHLDVLKWLRTNGCPWDERVCNSAAANGHLEVLQWARENRCPWDELACASAAHEGHLGVLQWARENDCPWGIRSCACAALGGRLEVLQWARENGCPWDVLTCTAAALGGHLEVLQWARENACPWNKSTCASAAGGGHLEVLQWARENGCPWDESTCIEASRSGHLDVLQWALENGCQWNR